MKLVLSAATAASLALSALLPTAAQADDPIVVKSHQPSVQVFADTLSSDISQGLDSALRGRTFAAGTPYGLTTVTFSVGDGGQVSDVEVVRRSGNWTLDSVARGVVRRLEVAGNEVPFRGTNRVRAYMIVAPDDDTYADLAKQARSIEQERQLAIGKSKVSGELVLTVSPRITG